MTPETDRAIALFEPWGLGDLAISLHWARAQAASGKHVTVLCAPAYVEWVRQLPFVAAAHGIHVPWTQKAQKYAIVSYPWAEWRSLRRQHSLPKAVFETRRDPRAQLLLRGLGFHKIHRPAIAEGYRRLDVLGAHSARETPPAQTKPTSVICFLGAEWPNRRVPDFKGRELLKILSQTGKKVRLIEPPGSDVRALNVPQEIECLSGSVHEIAAQISRHSHLLSTDSGWLHVGHLLGLRTIGLFGFDNDPHWAPPGSLVLHAEHVLPGKLRYHSQWRDVQPLGTLVTTAFADTLTRELL